MADMFYWIGFSVCAAGGLSLTGLMLFMASMLVSKSGLRLLNDLRAAHDVKLISKCMRDLRDQGKTKLKQENDLG